MSGVARLLREKGCVVSGSDVAQSRELDALGEAGVHVALGHDAAHVRAAAVVLWSPAVADDNVELVAARVRGATLLTRADVLFELARDQPVIGLSGTHGKTTATSMMVHVRRAAHLDDSRLLGAEVPDVGANGHWGRDALILEVDESFGSFARVAPMALGLLNIEPDHLDHYGTEAALEGAFHHLMERTTGPLVVWGDDPGVRRALTSVRRAPSVVSTTVGHEWWVTDVRVARRSAAFALRGARGAFEIELAVTGEHNVANAAVVAALALELGVAGEAVLEGLQTFRGAPRRFQYLGQWRGVDVYEDYAHLPGEIRATLAATRAAGYERIAAVFQPHRVTRSVRLQPEFVPAFDDAALVVITDIYDAGEANPTHATGEPLAQLVHRREPGRPSAYAATFDEVAAVLETWHDRSDVVLLLGAGDIAQVAGLLTGGVR